MLFLMHTHSACWPRPTPPRRPPSRPHHTRRRPCVCVLLIYKLTSSSKAWGCNPFCSSELSFTCMAVACNACCFAQMADKSSSTFLPAQLRPCSPPHYF
jgi:hypothetical protein